MGFHHGRLRVLHPTWTFPIMTYKQLIDNWYVENRIEKIPLLELLITLHVEHLVNPVNRDDGKFNLIYMISVMATLEIYVKK